MSQPPTRSQQVAQEKKTVLPPSGMHPWRALKCSRLLK